MLASSSPRRRDLLRLAGLEPRLRTAAVDERVQPGEDPLCYVTRLAAAKARAVGRHPGEVVVAADTSVVLGGEVLGKPKDERDAASMLERMSGRTHLVATGVAVRGVDDRCVQRVVTTQVHMAPLSPARIAAYVATGEPRDKAGAYAIQGRGAALVASIEGSWTNVVGLPLVETLNMLRDAGIAVD